MGKRISNKQTRMVGTGRHISLLGQTNDIPRNDSNPGKSEGACTAIHLDQRREPPGRHGSKLSSYRAHQQTNHETMYSQTRERSPRQLMLYLRRQVEKLWQVGKKDIQTTYEGTHPKWAPLHSRKCPRPRTILFTLRPTEEKWGWEKIIINNRGYYKTLRKRKRPIHNSTTSHSTHYNSNHPKREY